MSPSVAGLLADLRLTWREHRRYVGFATLLFVAGILVGALMWGRVDFFELIGLSPEEIFPDDTAALTPEFFLINNTRALLAILVLGVLTIGLVAVVGLAFNGLLVGYIVAPIVADQGIAFVIVGLLPHGVFELPALFVAGGVAFRLVHLAIDRVRGRRDRILTRSGWKRTGLLVGAAWVALIVAAVIEAYATPWLLETLFG